MVCVKINTSNYDKKILEILIAKSFYLEHEIDVKNADWYNISLHLVNQYIFDNYFDFIDFDGFSSNINICYFLKKYFELFDSSLYEIHRYKLENDIDEITRKIEEKKNRKYNWDNLPTHLTHLTCETLDENREKLELEYKRRYWVNKLKKSDEEQEFFQTKILPIYIIDNLNLKKLSSNPNKIVIKFLEKYPQFIDWTELSKNPYAIHILKKYRYKINWYNLSLNPNGIQILKD